MNQSAGGYLAGLTLFLEKTFQQLFGFLAANTVIYFRLMVALGVAEYLRALGHSAGFFI